jgi:Spy/CpxP family protein refolding chaperone
MTRLKQQIFASAGCVLVYLLVAAAVPASAQTAQAAPAAGPRRPLARLLKTPYRSLVLQLRGVKLTPQQRQQAAGVFKAHQPDLKALAGKLRAARQAWRQTGKIDLQERRNLNEQRMAVLQSVRTEIFALLTPEQQAQIQARRVKRLRRR